MDNVQAINLLILTFFIIGLAKELLNGELSLLKLFAIIAVILCDNELKQIAYGLIIVNLNFICWAIFFFACYLIKNHIETNKINTNTYDYNYFNYSNYSDYDLYQIKIK
jgi:hypothetical protein